MITYLVPDYDGRVLYYLADTPPAGAITAVPPAEMTDSNHHDYKWVDGSWVYAPVEQSASAAADDMTLDLLADHEYRLCMIELGAV